MNKIGFYFLSITVVFAARLALGVALTSNEISQIESDLGIVLSLSNQIELAAIVKPDAPDQWHIDAEARVDQYRKADLTLRVLDNRGAPVSGAEVEFDLSRKTFHFGGVMNLKRFAGETAMGISTNRYADLYLKFFDAAGLGNGLKAKLRSGNEAYLPGYFDWCAANNIESRGHTLIWPGYSHLPANIRGILDDLYATAETNGNDIVYDGQLKVDLDTAVDDVIAEWASLWPVYEWDVYNEPFGNHDIQEILGYDVMVKWFNIAKSNVVSPDCGLFINDNRMVSAMSASQYISRGDIYKGYIDYLISSNAPITGIGFQQRVKFEYGSPQLFYDRLDDFGSYNLAMAGTEFHIPNQAGHVPTTIRRAEMTEEVMATYFSHPRTTGLNCWSYHSDSAADGALINDDGSVNLNGLVWYYLNRIRYNTDAALVSDTMGNVSLRGFKGDYNITVSYGGNEYPATLTLASNQIAVVVLEDVLISATLLANWLAEFPGLGSRTNLTDNPDGDAANNLLEYAFGGDPTNGLDVGYWPTFQTLAEGDVGYIEYVYTKQKDAADRGLAYTLELATNLVSGVWTNAGYSVTGSNDVDSVYQAITNRIPTLIEDGQFIRLRVEYQ